MVDLEFESSRVAESVREALTELWGSGLAAPASVGSPRARIVETVEAAGGPEARDLRPC